MGHQIGEWSHLAWSLPQCLSITPLHVSDYFILLCLFTKCKNLLRMTESIALVLPTHFSFVPSGLNAPTFCFWLLTAACP